MAAAEVETAMACDASGIINARKDHAIVLLAKQYDDLDSERQATPLEQVQQAGQESSTSLGVTLPRNLSSPNKAVRDKAVAALGSWLSSCEKFEEADLIRIWEGILYCVWQTEKGIPVAELSRKISACLRSLSPKVAILNFKLLLSAIVKEWSGIEKRKLEKFRVLIRDCLSQIFKVLRAHGWDKEYITKFVEALGDCLSEETQPALHSVNIFLAQVFVEELRSVTPCDPETLRMLLEPFFAVFSTSGDKVVLQKVRDAVFLPLLQDARAASAKSGASGHVDKCLGSLVLGLPLAGKFFELAASPSVGAVNKKFLNQLYEDFSRSERGSPVRRLRKMKGRVVPEEKSPACLLSPAMDGARVLESAEEGSTPSERNEEAENMSTPQEEQQQEQELAPVTRSKRKRVDANGPQFERRVLRSEQRLLNSRRSSTDSEGSISSTRDSPDSNPPSSPRGKRKRRSSSSSSEEASDKEATSGNEDGSSGGNRCSDSEQQQGDAKRVRFSLRNNLVWTPHRPLPPQWVRVPPSVAPRGSAMKPGVEPGPIQSPPLKKRKGKKKSPKSAKKIAKKALKGKKRKKSV